MTSALHSAKSRHATPRILIVRIGAMGDILHALPAVGALRQALPDSFIAWAVEPRWQSLLWCADDPLAEATPEDLLVDKLHLVPTRVWKQRPLTGETLREIAALRKQMQAERYDLCVDLQGSIKSAAIGRLAGALRFVGPRQPRERQARALYGERVQTQAKHVIDQACELLGSALQPPRELAPRKVELPHDLQSDCWAAQLMTPATQSVLLVPSAGWGAKQWPASHYRELALTLNRQGRRVLVNAVGDADSLAAEIARDGVAFVVPCSIAGLLALCRRVDLVIGGDSGPVHLAAALGRPVVALFGPTDPERNGPRFPGAKTVVLRHATSRLSHKRLAEPEAGLRQITVEQVLEAAETLLRGSEEVMSVATSLSEDRLHG